MPSLKATLKDPAWREDVWLDVLKEAIGETGLDASAFPETCHWSMSQALDPEFWPKD